MSKSPNIKFQETKELTARDIVGIIENLSLSHCSAMAIFTTTRRALTTLLSRSFYLSSSPPSSISSRSRFALAILNQPGARLFPDSVRLPVRPKSSGSGYSPLNDPSPNWSNRPPKETILLDGCDYEHWLIVMEFTSDPKPSEDEMIDSYVKTLASVLGRYPTK